MKKTLIVLLTVAFFAALGCTKSEPTADGQKPSLGVTVNGITTTKTVPAGDFLSLKHNLNNSNLTFVAQYQENGSVFNWDSYYTRAGQIKPATMFENRATSANAVAALKNGYFVIAYRDDTNGLGCFKIYNHAGEIKIQSTTFSNGNMISGAEDSFTKIAVLNNGNFVIVYKDTTNGNKGKYVIINPAGTIIKSETAFSNAGATYATVSTLKDGSFVIAYRDDSAGGKGNYLILDENGTVKTGNTIFNNADTKYIASAPLNNGNFVLAYSNGGDASHGYYAIYTNLGIVVKAPEEFVGTAANWVTTNVLPNGKFVLTYDLQSGTLGCYQGGVYNPAAPDPLACAYIGGTWTNAFAKSFIVFQENGSIAITSTKISESLGGNYGFTTANALKDDSFIVFYKTGTEQRYVIYNHSGVMIQPESYIEKITGVGAASCSLGSMATLINGNVVFAYRDSTNSNYGTFTIKHFGTSYPQLTLEIISNNEVRIYNKTYETLNITLSVNSQ